MLRRIQESRERALQELKAESVELYRAAIAVRKPHLPRDAGYPSRRDRLGWLGQAHFTRHKSNTKYIPPHQKELALGHSAHLIAMVR